MRRFLTPEEIAPPGTSQKARHWWNYIRRILGGFMAQVYLTPVTTSKFPNYLITGYVLYRCKVVSILECPIRTVTYVSSTVYGATISVRSTRVGLLANLSGFS